MYTKQIRLNLGMTQEQFAKKLGVSKYTVQNWDQGQHQPTGDSALAIKRLLSRYDYDDLMISDKEFNLTHDDDSIYIVTTKSGPVKPNRYALTRRELFDFKVIQGKKTIFKI